jgi:hypothetical protein
VFDVAAKTGWLTTFTKAVPVSPKVRENLRYIVFGYVFRLQRATRAEPVAPPPFAAVPEKVRLLAQLKTGCDEDQTQPLPGAE